MQELFLSTKGGRVCGEIQAVWELHPSWSFGEGAEPEQVSNACRNLTDDVNDVLWQVSNPVDLG